MLKEYEKSQPIAYNIINRALIENKLSHAYIIEGFGNLSFDFVISIVKEIATIGKNQRDREIIINQIDNGNYVNIKVIENDGNWIKKEQILDLKTEFSKKATNNDPLVYIIKDANKLNDSSGNMLLKFLEEPELSIYAFLLTENSKQVIETILSRAQLLRLNSDKENIIEYFSMYNLNNEEVLFLFSNVEKALMQFELIGFNSRRYFDALLKEDIFKNNPKILFDIMIFIYRNAISQILSFEYDKKLVELITKQNSISQITNKISIIDQAKSKLKHNANIQLLFDQILIYMEGDA